MENEFGIVANVVETDHVLRLGAKAWLVHAESGGERVVVSAKSRGGRCVEKHTSLTRLANFRAAWIPEHVRSGLFIRESGTRADMEARAMFWNARADEERVLHPNRVTGHTIEPV